MFRLIQSIPSPKAEPFKQWMAQVASERLDEMQDTELAIDRAMEYYRNYISIQNHSIPRSAPDDSFSRKLYCPNI